MISEAEIQTELEKIEANIPALNEAMRTLNAQREEIRMRIQDAISRRDALRKILEISDEVEAAKEPEAPLKE